MAYTKWNHSVVKTDKIKGLLREKGLTYISGAMATNISVPSFSRKMSGKSPIYCHEASAIAALLRMTKEEAADIFLS